MKFNWKIGGEAGYGIMTTGTVISKIATRSGYHIFSYFEYPSLIRGGNNTVEVVFSDDEITASKWKVNMLVCLNKETFDLHKHRLSKDSIVMYDPDSFEPDIECKKVPLPLKKIKEKQEIHQQMLNTVSVGASIAMLGGDVGIFEDILKHQFARKGQEVVDFNIKLARVGFDQIKADNVTPLNILSKKSETPEKLVLTGNDAFSIGTAGADCKYYAAYPMTPSSSILMSLAAWQDKTQMVVRHSEDEIAVINSALGASFAGARSSVGTSGGGFALMVEALSYAGVAEIPIVVFLGMRPGPATGMPTWTEQGDLLFATQAGHGEFPKIVLAPGDVSEMIELTLTAFDLADFYQLPVIVVSDKFLCESYKDVLKEVIEKKLKNYTPNRGKIVAKTNQSPYLRYKYEEDGVSEMLIPGQKGAFYQANSYEHIEDTHTTEESEPRKKQVEKRNKKWDTYLNKLKVKSEKLEVGGNVFFEGPKIYGDPNADTVFVSWGGTKGIVLEAQKMLASEHNKNIAFLHFTHMYPLDEELVKSHFNNHTRYILVENNSHAQFGQLLRMQTGIDIKEKLLKYDGRPFFPEEIVKYIIGEKGEPMEQKQQTAVNNLENNKNTKPNLPDQKEREEEMLKKLSARMMSA